MAKYTRFIPRRIRSYLAETRAKARIPIYNIGYRLIGSLDGYPFPPNHLIDFVIGTKEIAWYQLGGLFMHQAIGTMLRRNGLDINQLTSVLDFGCGCGRILRWWAGLKENCEIWGCDYNPDLIAWCQNELGDIAHYKVNNADPPLDFPDGKFELVYAYSVLTHFATDQQQPWIKELARVVKPGGMLLVTVHGKRVAMRSGFSSELFAQLNEQGVIVFGEDQRGSNYCAAYHSEPYMQNQHMNGLELLESLPGGVRDSSEQDMYLYRKLAAIGGR